MTVDEVAEILQITVSTVRTWVSEKKIPYHKIGGRVRFTEGDLKAFEVQTRVALAKDHE